MNNNLDNEWMMFLQGSQNPFSNEPHYNSLCSSTSSFEENAVSHDKMVESIPECEDLYVSTKTVVLFLNQPIDINRIFWLIPIADYNSREDCVIKKQMKIVSKSREEYEEYKSKLKDLKYYSEHIIKEIDNPDARRIKFKDERKITVGLSKKDIMVCRGKVKNAFYNCFAMILRFYQDGEFKEIHVKVFNTGKLEIPGLLNDSLLESVKMMIHRCLQPHIEKQLEFGNPEVVLINSNFNCGFYINRDKLHKILRSEKYNIEAAYDPCSYPGVKCKFYYNNEIEMNSDPVELLKQNGLLKQQDRTMKMSELVASKKYTEISFMIFRTGSCLIVGNCNEKPLDFVYEFIKKILQSEYYNIVVQCNEEVVKNKKPKIRKKKITMTKTYYETINEM